MKRFILVVALCMALISLFTAVVFADDFSNDQQFIQILDYSSANDTGSNYFEYTGSGKIRYALPYAQVKQYVDMIVWSTTSSFTLTEDSSSLTVESIGNRLYRVYGALRGSYGSALYLAVSSSSTSTQAIEFRSINFSSVRSAHFIETGSLRVTGGHLSNTYSETMSSASDVLTCSFPYNSETDMSFTAQFSCPDWRNYDYIDFDISGFGLSTDSIYASVNGINIPLSLSFIDGSSGGANSVVYRFVARLDLRGLDRSSTYTPILGVRAFPINTVENIGSFIQLNSVNGYVVQESISHISILFNRLTSSLSNFFSALAARQDAYHADIQAWQQAHDQLLISKFDLIVKAIVDQTINIRTYLTNLQAAVVNKLASFQTSTESWFTTISSQLDELIHPDTSDSEQFEDDIASQATEMEDISETLDSVTKPSVDDLNPSVDDIVSPDDIENYTSILGILLGNNIFLSVCLMSFTLALVSYTLYGKR